MPISMGQFNAVKNDYQTLMVFRKVGNVISAVTIEIEGIVGGNGNDRNNKIKYYCLIDLSRFPENIAKIFILNPPESKIKHVNIYHPRDCPILNKRLPEICSGNFERIIQNINTKNINVMPLILLLTGLKRILNTQNHNDPAR